MPSSVSLPFVYMWEHILHLSFSELKQKKIKYNKNVKKLIGSKWSGMHNSNLMAGQKYYYAFTLLKVCFYQKKIEQKA